MSVLFICITAVCLIYAGGTKDATSRDGMSGAAAQEQRPETVRISALNGPSGIGMAYMFENAPDLGGVPSSFEVSASADVLLPKLLKLEAYIGILPPNAPAKVYTKNNGAIAMRAVVGEGMLSLITKDPSVQSLGDLKGKKVNVAGQGATPEYMFRYLLEQAGINASDAPGADAVELDFSIPSAEIAAAVISGKIGYAVVPEPFATVAVTRDSSVRRAVDLQKLWAGVPGNPPEYPMTVVVIRAGFARQYPETVRRFLEAYRQSIEWTNAHPAEAGVLVEKYTLGLKAPIVAAAVPHAAFSYTPAGEARPAVEQLFSVFMKFAPESIGGSLPAEGFYFR